MKTALLMTGLTLILIWAGNAFGGQSGMTIALMLALIMNVGSYWFSDKIVLKMYKAQEVTEAAAPELFSMVRRLAQKGGLPMPRVYIINENQPNAFATGRNPEHAAVAVTTGIMNILSQEERTGPRKKQRYTDRHCCSHYCRSNKFSCKYGTVGNDFRRK
jgi:heat shock protein HtpX